MRIGFPSAAAPGPRRARRRPRCSGALLVEALRAQGLGESNAEPFPFIAGYVDDRRIPLRWICFSDEARAPAGNPYLLELGRDARQRLLEHLSGVGASHVLFSEVPGPALLKFLARRRPALQIRHCAARKDFYDRGWLADWLGAAEERGGFLPDLTTPIYRCLAADRPPPAPLPTPLIGSAPCFYAAPLAGNPSYRGVDLSGIERRFACAFCPGPSALKYRYRTPAIDLAMRQIKAVQGEARTLWSRTEFLVRSAELFFAMSEFLRRLELEEVPPISLFFSCRADEVLARAQDIGRALAIAKRRGHGVHIFSMGAENFSPAENERFNKGLSLAGIRPALELLRAWERDYPETFFFTRHGGLGFILFTPWTTLEDLRLNLKAARELGLSEDGFLLTRRVMLFADIPLTRLAEQDGLVDPRDPEDLALFSWLQKHCDPGCRHFLEEEDRPWKFRDPRAARVCAIAARMAKRDGIVEDDPYHRRIAEALDSAGVRLLDAFSLLLTLAEHRRNAGLDDLLSEFLGLLRRLAVWKGARHRGTIFPIPRRLPSRRNAMPL